MKHSHTGVYAGAIYFVRVILFLFAATESVYNGVEIAAPRA